MAQGGIAAELEKLVVFARRPFVVFAEAQDAFTAMTFAKGQTGVQIDLSKVPHGREKGAALARKIAGRI